MSKILSLLLLSFQALLASKRAYGTSPFTGFRYQNRAVGAQSLMRSVVNKDRSAFEAAYASEADMLTPDFSSSLIDQVVRGGNGEVMEMVLEKKEFRDAVSLHHFEQCIHGSKDEQALALISAPYDAENSIWVPSCISTLAEAISIKAWPFLNVFIRQMNFSIEDILDVHARNANNMFIDQITTAALIIVVEQKENGMMPAEYLRIMCCLYFRRLEYAIQAIKDRKAPRQFDDIIKAVLESSPKSLKEALDAFRGRPYKMTSAISGAIFCILKSGQLELLKVVRTHPSLSSCWIFLRQLTETSLACGNFKKFHAGIVKNFPMPMGQRFSPGDIIHERLDTIIRTADLPSLLRLECALPKKLKYKGNEVIAIELARRAKAGHINHILVFSEMNPKRVALIRAAWSLYLYSGNFGLLNDMMLDFLGIHCL